MTSFYYFLKVSPFLHGVVFLLSLWSLTFQCFLTAIISQNRQRILMPLAQVCCILHHLIPPLTVFQVPFLLEQLSCYLTFSRACHLEDFIYPSKKCILVVLFRKAGVRNISRRLETCLSTDLFIYLKLGFYIGTTFDLVKLISLSK